MMGKAAGRLFRIVMALLLCAAVGACGGRKAVPPAEEYERAGDEAFARQDYVVAVESYRQALQSGTPKIRVLNNLGNSLLRDGKYNAAREQYLKALTLDPEYLFAINNLTVALYLGGDREGAYKLLAETRMAYPEVSFLRTTYGFFRYREGDLAGARQAFEEAKSINPASPAALNNLGMLSLEEDPIPDDTLGHLMAAVKINPGNKLFRDSLGWYFFKVGRFADATIEIGQAFLYDPENLEVRTHYATVLEWIGKDREALEQWEQVLELSDDAATTTMARNHYWQIRGRLPAAPVPGRE